MEWSDLEDGSASYRSKYEYILNWISGDSAASSQGWIDEGDTLYDRHSNTSICTAQQSDSGIDEVPQSRWVKFKMWVLCLGTSKGGLLLFNDSSSSLVEVTSYYSYAVKTDPPCTFSSIKQSPTWQNHMISRVICELCLVGWNLCPTPTNSKVRMPIGQGLVYPLSQVNVWFIQDEGQSWAVHINEIPDFTWAYCIRLAVK